MRFLDFKGYKNTTLYPKITKPSQTILTQSSVKILQIFWFISQSWKKLNKFVEMDPFTTIEKGLKISRKVIKTLVFKLLKLKG